MAAIESESPTTLRRIVSRKVRLRISVTEGGPQYLVVSAEARDGSRGITRRILVCPRPAPRTRPGRTSGRLFGLSCWGADRRAGERYSRDASARDGGDLGTLKRGELALDIETQILSLSPGQSPLRIAPRSGITSSDSNRRRPSRARVWPASELRSARFSSAKNSTRAATRGSRRSNSAPSSTCAWMDNSEEY
jgi:hypothetical protein